MIELQALKQFVPSFRQAFLECFAHCFIFIEQVQDLELRHFFTIF